MENAINQVPPTTPPISELIEKPQRKVSPIILILIGVVLFLSLAVVLIVVFFFPLKSKEIDNSNVDNRLIKASDYDVSEYTDIKLKDYKGLIVDISEENEEAPEFITGIVFYGLESFYDRDGEDFVGPVMQMEIVSREMANSDKQLERFNDSLDIILNRDIDALSQDSGFLDAFETYGPGFGVDFVKELEDVQYPGFDEVLAIFAWGPNHEPPYAFDIGTNFTIGVYAVKDKDTSPTLVQLFAYAGDTYEDLKISEEVHNSCKVIDPGDENNPKYDLNCFSNAINTGDFDTEIYNVLNTLLERFAIEE